MQKLLVLSLALITALFIFALVGCDQDNISDPYDGNPFGVASIELRVTHDQIRGFTGDIRTEQITAIARDGQGVAVPEAEINFAIRNPESWKGTISTPQANLVTDENGQLIANYSVSIEKTTDVGIEATCGQVSDNLTISVIVVNDVIGSLTMETSSNVLAVPPNQSNQTTVTASLVDTDGNALPGMQLHFRTNPPSMGFVDSDTATTDFNGRATRNFTSIVNKYGFCEVSAQVGEYTGSTSIEIRPIAAPAYVNLSTETPIVKVSEGQNATVNLYAVVTDLNRVGVPGTKVAFEVLPFLPGDPTFGSLSAVDTTDINGEVNAEFKSLGSFGKVIARIRVLPSTGDEGVSAGEVSDNPDNEKGQKHNSTAGADGEQISDEIVIEIKELNIDIGSLTLRALPNFLSLPPDSNGVSNILAQVRDIDNVGIPNVKVNFKTDLGTISEITITNNAGVANAVFYNNYEAGVAHVTASIPGTMHEVSTGITIQQSQGATGILALTSDKTFIYADNGVTTATLSALLSDEEGQALAGKEVIFTKTHGTVNSPVMTDSTGIARAVFRDVGEPSTDINGTIIPAVITARYSPLGLNTSIEITILEQNPVASIALQSAAEQMTAGSGDSTTVRATCFLANGSFAPEGTLVRYETNLGHFSQDAVPVTSVYGVAETNYIAGSIVGVSTLRAFVENETEIIYSNDISLNLLPGSPSKISLNAFPDELVTNDPNIFAEVVAVVSDTVNNPVAQGTMVRFETTKGTITPSAITDSNGRAIARLTAGIEAGLAEIKSTVQTPGGEIFGNTTVNFISGSPNSIELSADPLHIAVNGTGAVTTSAVTAEVRDANGNLVQTPTQVMFELLNESPEPAGCNFNNRGQIDSAMTANGRAVVSLNAGTQIGGKLIRAYTWRDEARTNLVSVTLATMAVVSGPPYSLDIDLNDNGTDVNGGAWKIEVSARVFDMHHNPVANNIPVVFTVEPDIASVSTGYTGNIGSDNSSDPGLAFADLFYQSSQTFSPISISASVATPEGQISGSKDHILPLQDGELDLHFDPANWMFAWERPNELCTIRIWVVLKDRHQIEINNAPILFSAEMGDLYWYDYSEGSLVEFFPDIARKYSGVVDQYNDEESGQATVFLRGRMADFFLDPFSTTQSVEVDAAVEGYFDVRADPGFVFFTRPAQ